MALLSDLSCLISLDGIRHSVPAAFAGRQVLVRAYTDRVEIACGDLTRTALARLPGQ